MIDFIRCTAVLSTFALFSPSLAQAQQQDAPSFTVGTATAQRGTMATGTIPRIVADSTTFFFASVDRDARVKKGQVLGYTTDLLGKRIGDVVAPIDGLVTFIRSVPSAWRGATLATVLPIITSPSPWKAPTP